VQAAPIPGIGIEAMHCRAKPQWTGNCTAAINHHLSTSDWRRPTKTF